MFYIHGNLLPHMCGKLFFTFVLKKVKFMVPFFTYVVGRFYICRRFLHMSPNSLTKIL